MTGEDLGYKPVVVEKAETEYSLPGKIFNKGLAEDDKKQGLLKRFKNIDGKNKDQSRDELRIIKRDLDKANENAFKRLNISKLGPDSKKSFLKLKSKKSDWLYKTCLCTHKCKDL